MAEHEEHLNESDVEWELMESPKGRFQAREKMLPQYLTARAKTQPSFGGAEATDATLRRRPFEVDLVSVSPGKLAWPRHYHSMQWEYYIVLSGHGEMLQEEGQSGIPMKPGEHIVQPPGWVHTIANTGDEDLVYYVIADNPVEEHCYYPDTDKWYAAGATYRPQEVDYWDGEE